MIKIGPAGFGGEAMEGLHRIKQLGLDAVEVEFVYGVRMTNAQAKKVGDEAKKLGISISVHAPYYINLGSTDRKILSASKKRILDSCERGHWLGAGERVYVVFHPGYYGKLAPGQCYEIVKRAIVEMQKAIRQKKWNAILAPETTGKVAQFGNLDELVRLSKETGCAVCVDFAHLKARHNGKIDYREVFEKLKQSKQAQKHIPAHMSGIEWTERGEKRHLVTKESDIRELLRWVKKCRVDINIINESPDPCGDSVKTMKILKSMS